VVQDRGCERGNGHSGFYKRRRFSRLAELMLRGVGSRMAVTYSILSL
jgi:hypothetical protein